MAESERLQKGREMRRALMGDEYAARINRTVYDDPMMQKFIDVASENIFGSLWTRPGLDLKTRTLICVVSDAATGRPEELALHLRIALRQGRTMDGRMPLLVHLLGYGGTTLIREAMLPVRKVFAPATASAAERRPAPAARRRAGARPTATTRAVPRGGRIPG